MSLIAGLLESKCVSRSSSCLPASSRTRMCLVVEYSPPSPCLPVSLLSPLLCSGLVSLCLGRRMAATGLINPSPQVLERRQTTRKKTKHDDEDDDEDDDDEEEEEKMTTMRMMRKTTNGMHKRKKKKTQMQRKGVAMLYAIANAERGNTASKEQGERVDEMDADHTSGGRAAGQERESIDALEVFEHVRDIRDPEHPYSLEQLSVVGEDRIKVDDEKGRVSVSFTPTVQHCSMATLIGLSLRVKLMRVLPPRFKVDVRVSPGSHASESAVNKQLNDKERVCAALENPNLIDMVMQCIGGGAGGEEGNEKKNRKQ